MDMILHDFLIPGLPELPGARDTLPSLVHEDECVIACYTNTDDTISITGYYLSEGHWQGRICHPDDFAGDISVPTSKYSIECGTLPNKNQASWAGGDTGGFYRPKF
jgi:hypothetical protein